ncbi:SDR family oxidoreductase [Hwanghaeella grinnelliae]|nr:SDR family oxidoreductase [Hwanghaeella grinnelliae]
MEEMKVLVLGAYGLIGLEVSKALIKAGNTVVALGRSADHGRKVLPNAHWIGTDLSQMTGTADWLGHLEGIEAVVNASGALQDSPGQKLSDVQSRSITTLVAACEQTGVRKFVQISAPGAAGTASLAFLSTKGEADDTLKRSGLDWTVLKPGLVIAPTAYGGTSLVRSIAAFPFVQPVVFANSPVQTVSIADVTGAVVRSLTDPALSRRAFDLVETESHTLAQVILAVRQWLAFPAPLRVIDVPPAIARLLAKCADAAAWLGWRSALRTTSLQVLAGGITADSGDWVAATGIAPRSLTETLIDLPSTLQERVFARLRLIAPLLILVLSLFWLASGVIGLVFEADAVRVIEDDLPPLLAHASVIGGSCLDIAVGLALLFRKTARTACLASVGVSLLYLGLGTVLTPELWADPLGVFVKVLPAIGLSLAAASMIDER